MISFARIAILDPALSSIVPNTQHFGCVSNEFHMELSEELCKRNEASPLPGPFQKDSVVSERLLGELCLLLFTPGIVPLSRIDRKKPRTSSVVKVLFPIVWKMCVFHQVWTYWNTTRQYFHHESGVTNIHHQSLELLHLHTLSSMLV